MLPIDTGETLHRIIGKAVSLVTQIDIEAVCGVDQLCAGAKAGIEQGIHAMNDLHAFEANKDTIDGCGVLLVDATNVFSSISRVAVLWNAHVLRPRRSCFRFNTYRGWAVLMVQ